MVFYMPASESTVMLLLFERLTVKRLFYCVLFSVNFLQNSRMPNRHFQITNEVCGVIKGLKSKCDNFSYRAWFFAGTVGSIVDWISISLRLFLKNIRTSLLLLSSIQRFAVSFCKKFNKPIKLGRCWIVFLLTNSGVI